MERRYLAATIAMAATFAVFSHAFGSGLLTKVQKPRETLISEMRCAAQTLRTRLLDKVNRSLGSGSAEEAQLRVELNLPAPAVAAVRRRTGDSACGSCGPGSSGEDVAGSCLSGAAAGCHSCLARLRTRASAGHGDAVEGHGDAGKDDGCTDEAHLASHAARDHPRGPGTSASQHRAGEDQLSFLHRST